MQIIQVPSVFSCKLPGGEWLNLALIRRLQLKSDPFAVAVTWANGDSQEYRGDKAAALLEAWEEAKSIDKSAELGAIDAQLLGNGVKNELVAAVRNSDWNLACDLLVLVINEEQRHRLGRIIERFKDIAAHRLMS